MLSSAAGCQSGALPQGSLTAHKVRTPVTFEKTASSVCGKRLAEGLVRGLQQTETHPRQFASSARSRPLRNSRKSSRGTCGHDCGQDVRAPSMVYQ
jgi:hypothetical protein